MSTQMKLIVGGGATVALAAARMFVMKIDGYSPWCLAGGAVAAYAGEIVSALPSSLVGVLPLAQGGLVLSVIALGGAAALEMSYDGALSAADLSQAGFTRFAIGAAAAAAGAFVAPMLALWVSQRV